MFPVIFLLLLAVLPCRESRSEETLASALETRMRDMDEFARIRELAKKKGVRVWLFGGTAATLAFDTKRTLGLAGSDKPAYRTLDQVIRSTQDRDLIADGDAAKVAELEAELDKMFRPESGSLAKWEVRPLREGRGRKLPLLTKEFLDQNNDSLSTGLIEITEPPAGEARVRDLRAWDKGTAPFLEDVAAGKIRYLHSADHLSTPLFLDGRNPEIFSVIRFLNKALQFNLPISRADERKVKEIVAAFDPKSVGKADPYVAHWIETQAKKLVLHSADIERSRRVLDDVGLRDKLLALGETSKEESLAWLLDREPLPSGKVGEGKERRRASWGSIRSFTRPRGSPRGNPCTAPRTGARTRCNRAKRRAGNARNTAPAGTRPSDRPRTPTGGR